MKCFAIFLIALSFFSVSLFAQRSAKNNTSAPSKVSLVNLITETNNSFVISSDHISSISGIHHYYLRQAINGMEVQGTESSVHIAANGQTIAEHNRFLENINATVKNSVASLTGEQAIRSVATQMGYTITNLTQTKSEGGVSRKAMFNKAGISSREIPVKLVYYYREGKGTSLVWELSIAEITSLDWWSFRVDAATGKILDKNNLTNSCNIMGDHDHGKEGKSDGADTKKSHTSIIEPAPPIYTALEESSSLMPSYMVFALPLEDPYAGPRTLEVNPANLNSSPLGWHDDGTTTYTYTRGNNAIAYDNGDVGSSGGEESDAAPQSAPGLIFDYAFDATEPGGNPIYTAAAQSEHAAITNLFYWTNIIHDILYQYGFDEAAGNFQVNNFGNGGFGTDRMHAQVQYSADLLPGDKFYARCNASFGTGTDGVPGYITMLICDGAATAGSNDGAFDSGVIIHEYGHGISRRLVYGGGSDNALSNQEQMGEGWSDFYGYMLTMSAANATSDRTIGNFTLDLGATGGGFRIAPYSTNMTTNPWTYAGVANTAQISEPHGIGFIWASMLYEMTQALIARDGFDADLYNGTGGNNTALKLVTEGLKFTSFLPGFVDVRDAILAADMAMYGGANQCLIWTAFAKRGLGFSAMQGSSNNRLDGVEAFDLPVAAFVAPSRTDICVGEGIVTGLSGGTFIGGVYSGTNVIDAGDGNTFSFDATAAGIGVHAITYTDCSATSAMANITVIDDIPIIVSCFNDTLALDSSGMAIYDPLALIPANLLVVGSNNTPGGSTAPGSTTIEVSITEDVTISFDWLFDSIEDVPGWDHFGYTLNGTFINLSNGAPYPLSSNSSVSLGNGDVFGFTVTTDDNGAGAATSTITNFSPGFGGQFDEDNWTEILVNSDGSTNFSGTTPSTTITNGCGSPTVVSASQTVFTCNDIGDNIVTLSVDNGVEIGTCDITVTIIAPSPTPCIALMPKVYLQGPSLNPNTGEETLMRDDLRVAGLLPIASPYSDGLACDITVFNVTGADAIVDWVWLELRDATDRSVVVEGRSALLQRDGDIVDVDGTSTVSFQAISDNYYLLVAHRNHLSILSALAVAMTTPTIVDLSSDALLVFGDNSAVLSVGGVFAMISGDAQANGQIQNTDISEVLPHLGTAGYSNLDTDMNGQVQNTDINISIISNLGRGIQY